MTISTGHKPSLSSIITSACETLSTHPNTEKYRIFAATRGQILTQDPKHGLTMRPCWLLLRSNFDKTGSTWLEFQPLFLSTERPSPSPIPLNRAFLDMMTDDRHVFGGETLIYEKGSEPVVAGHAFETEAAIEACLRAPKNAKIAQPVELELIEYDARLILNGPEEFFVPATADGSPAAISARDSRHPFYSFTNFPNWIALRPNSDDTDDTDQDNMYSALIDISNDPEFSAPRVVLIPTLWLPETISLSFQTDWCAESHDLISTTLKPFNIAICTTDGELSTDIYYTKPH